MATDVYSMPDLTKKVRYDRGQRRDAEDSGQLEEKGEMVEMVDNDIYESVDDIVSGPQEDMREDTAGRHTQGHRSKTVRRPFRVVALGLGMLCLIQLGVIIGQAVHYHSANNQLTTKYNNLILETNHSLTRFDNLTHDRDQLQSEVKRLQGEKADHSANNQLMTKYNNVILERDELNRSIYNLLALAKNLSLTLCNDLTQESDWQSLKEGIGALLGGWKKKILNKFE